MGRFNFYHVAEVVEAISATNVVGNSTTTAPDALSTMRTTLLKAKTFA